MKPRTARACLVALLALAAAPTAAVAATPARQLEWRSCGERRECAAARVPLDHDQPRGRMISLALVRVPASDPSRRIGTVFVNPGGPGSSGADFVRDFGDDLLTPAVRARFDLVGFDPRGVGASTPVRCFASAEEQQTFLAPLPEFPVGRDEKRRFRRAMGELGRRCRERNGDLLEHLSTANVARDLDLLRRAVADRRLTFAGYSYGALLGLTYAGLYPERVRALMLDGPVDPVAWFTGRGPLDRRLPFSVRVGSHLASSDALGVFLDRCQAAGEDCAFAAFDTRARFDALLVRLLEVGPVTADTPVGPLTVGYADVIEAMRGSLTVPQEWALVAEILVAVERAARARAPGAATASAAPANTYDNEDEAQLAIACSETDNPRNPHRWAPVARLADRQAPYFGALWTFLSQACATWPARDSDRYLGPFDRPTAAPVLLVGTTHDPLVPFSGVERLARELPNATLLTLDSPGHLETNVSSACVRRAVERYLIAATLPPPATVCAPDTQPFEPPS